MVKDSLVSRGRRNNHFKVVQFFANDFIEIVRNQGWIKRDREGCSLRSQIEVGQNVSFLWERGK